MKAISFHELDAKLQQRVADALWKYYYDKLLKILLVHYAVAISITLIIKETQLVAFLLNLIALLIIVTLRAAMKSIDQAISKTVMLTT